MKPNTQNLLTGKSVRLRAPEPTDIDLLYAWENDTSVWRVSNTLAPLSRFQVEEYVLNQQHDLFAEKQLRLMIDFIQENGNNEPIGTIDLFDYNPLHLRAGVGILVREPCREKGYASEALEILEYYSGKLLMLHQLYCTIMSGNEASIRLFEKHGFVRIGIKKEWIREGDSWCDELLYQKILS